MNECDFLTYCSRWPLQYLAPRTPKENFVTSLFIGGLHTHTHTHTYLSFQVHRVKNNRSWANKANEFTRQKKLKRSWSPNRPLTFHLKKSPGDCMLHYSETRLYWPPLVLFKAAKLIQVANLLKPLDTKHIHKCTVQSAGTGGRVRMQGQPSQCMFVCLFLAQQPSLGQGLLIYEVSISHTQRRTTVRTPLDEWSARRRDLYLTTHNTHNRQPCP